VCYVENLFAKLPVINSVPMSLNSLFLNASYYFRNASHKRHKDRRLLFRWDDLLNLFINAYA